MKVYLRHVDADAPGAYIGDVAPHRLMEVFQAVKEASVFDVDNAYYVDLFHCIEVSGDEAVFSIQWGGAE